MAKFHARTDIGLKRKHNEDAMLALEDMGVFVVADGVGGRNAGELASSITVNTFQSYAPQFKILLSEYAADPNLKTRNAILNELHTVANMASQRVYDASHAMSRQGMTTTLVAALVGGGSAFVVHVGDSRAYVVRDGKLRQLTEDHSMVNELLRTGTLTPGDEASKRYRNVITRAVGLYPTVRADTLHIELLKDDRLLLCTDGLSDLVDADAILTLMNRHKLRDAIDNLVDAALGKGGKDNITAIAIQPEALLEADAVTARAIAMENIFLFADLPYQARLRVSRIVSEKFVSPKTHLVRQGEMGDTLYVVVQGEVSVIVDGQEVAVLTNGEHFGELTLVDQQPRSADVFANSFVHVLCIDRESLYEYCTLEPALGNRLLWKLVATLGQRLRQANQQITGGNN